MTTAQFSTNCPHCNAAMRVKQSLVGQFARCSSCKQKFELTSISSAASIDVDQDALSVAESMVSTLDKSGEATTTISKATSKDSKNDGPNFGRFRLQKILGQGGFGKVYLAYDPALDRMLAIKVPIFSSDDTRRVQRFLTEAKAAARLRHPNIVPTFESGQVDGRYFIAAQYISGKPLNEVIKTGQYDRREAIGWVVALADALSYSHQNEIVHRDVKPHNVMIDENRHPQLMDFGLARRGDDDSAQTTDGTLLGTPAYMPPEQARGSLDEIGPHSDQYSLGVILYELLTRQRPFQGEPHAVIHQVLNDEPIAARQIDRTIRRDLNAICRKAMSKLPSDRYVSCEALAEDLRRWLRGESTTARPLSVFRQFGRWVRKNPILGAASIVCIAAVGSVAILATAVAIDQQKRNEAAESALKIADQRKEEALRANSTLAENERVLQTSLTKRDEAIAESKRANQRALEQATLAEQQRQAARDLLMANHLQKLTFEKRQLFFPESLKTLETSRQLALELGKNELANGLDLDRAFIEWIAPNSRAIESELPGETNQRNLIVLNQHVSLFPKANGEWQLWNRAKQEPYGEPFQMKLADSTAVRSTFANTCVAHAVSETQIIWYIAKAETDKRFLSALERHSVDLESGNHSISPGPRFMPVAIGSASLPIWLGLQGKKLAYRSLDNAEEIVILDGDQLQPQTMIASPPKDFVEAAFGPSEESFALVERDDNNRYTLTLFETAGPREKKSVIFRGVDNVKLEPAQNLVVSTKAGLTEVRTLDRGKSIAKFSATTGQLIARGGDNGQVGILDDQLLSLSTLGRIDSFRLAQLDPVIDFQMNKAGGAWCTASNRNYLLDLNARLLVGSTEKQAETPALGRHARMPDAVEWNARQTVPGGDWVLAGFVDSEHAMLIEPEIIDCFQLMGRFAVRHEVERFKSLSILALADMGEPNSVTSITGFAGRQRVVSVATFGKKAANIADKKQIVSPEILARISAAEDAITISSTGRFAIVREVQSAPTLAIYDLTAKQLRGEQHLTESLLIDRSLFQPTDGLLGIRGQARFSPTDELFVYRLNRDTLGMVLMESGKRVGKIGRAHV